MTPASIPRITAGDLRQRASRGETIALLDARSEHAFATAGDTIPGSIRVSPDEADLDRARIDSLLPPSARAIVAWCT